MFQILKGFFKKKVSVVSEGQYNSVSVPDSENCLVNVFGNNNYVHISDTARFNGKIDIYGNSNILMIGDGSNISAKIKIGAPQTPFSCPITSASLLIGKRVYMGGARIVLMEDVSLLSIGDDCAIAEGVDIWCSDTHSILDDKGELTNAGRYTRIGDHCWIGKDAKIGKNVVLEDNNIVGWGSVVTKSFYEHNTVIAGNPAKIVKRNAFWDKMSPNLMMQNQRD